MRGQQPAVAEMMRAGGAEGISIWGADDDWGMARWSGRLRWTEGDRTTAVIRLLDPSEGLTRGGGVKKLDDVLVLFSFFLVVEICSFFLGVEILIYLSTLSIHPCILPSPPPPLHRPSPPSRRPHPPVGRPSPRPPTGLHICLPARPRPPAGLLRVRPPPLPPAGRSPPRPASSAPIHRSTSLLRVCSPACAPPPVQWLERWVWSCGWSCLFPAPPRPNRARECFSRALLSTSGAPWYNFTTNSSGSGRRSCTKRTLNITQIPQRGLSLLLTGLLYSSM